MSDARNRAPSWRRGWLPIARRAGLRLALSLACLLLLAPRAVRAQVPSAYEDATERAVVEFNHGNWEEAQALFRRAHELEPNARTRRGLGLCAFELRQYVQATGELEAALIDPHKPLTPEQREHVKTLLAQARDFVSIYHVRVTPPDAEVFVDGRLTKLEDNLLHLDPGPHVVLVRAPGYQERRAEFRAGAGVQDELSIELSLAQPDGKSIDLSQRSSRAVASPPRKRRVWTWTLASGALASAVAAVGLRVGVRRPEREHDECRAANGHCDAVRAYADKLLRGSYAMAAVSGALALGATASFWLESGDQESRATALTVGVDGLQLRGTF